jgi:tetratricopeptide (TPR) repeat protein
MSQKNPKPSPSGKSTGPSRTPEPTATSLPSGGDPVPQGPLPPLFRGVDWVAFLVTAVITMIGYWWTLAPDLTLEDSGELAVASQYAGVPHPPGYPVWTVYTWLFTLLPFGNIAYRVGLSSAFAAALSCGFIAMMVSRGSSMLLEGIAMFKALERKLEGSFCIVSGIVAGLLMGFNGFMWSQAVIVEVYTLSVLSLTGVLICLMRWIYSPTQHRYLYLAFFWFGICFNNHQSLLVTAMGLEVAIIAAAPRLGREFLFWNVILFFAGLVLAGMGFIPTLKENDTVMLIFSGLGVLFTICWLWLAVTTKKNLLELVRDLCLVAWLGCLGLILGKITNYLELFEGNPGRYLLVWMAFIATFSCFFILTFTPRLLNLKPLGNEWWPTLASGIAWTLGAAFYIYMPLASMSNPPLNWGYPRTVTGFFHAFTRGQYERIHPTTESTAFLKQIDYTLIDGTLTEFNVMCFVFGLILGLWWLSRRDWSPQAKAGVIVGYCAILALFMGLMSPDLVGWVESHRLNALWILLVAAVYCALAPLFTLFLNPTFLFWREMQKRERAWIVALTAIYVFLGPFLMLLLNPPPDRQAQELNKVFFTASQVLISMGIGYGITLLLALMATAYSQIRMPIVAGLGVVVFLAVLHCKDAFLNSAYGLHHFTAVYALVIAAAGLVLMIVNLQAAPLRPFLALLLLAPGYSVLSHWENNEQRGHLFGYWFGHDMFTPPMKGKDGKPIYPEMDKHTVLFGGTDPGRFNPTYMIFCESFLDPKFKPNDPNFDRRDVYLITQNALADGTYLQYIRAHYNRVTQPDPPFFSELLRGPRELAENTQTNWLARLALPVDRFFLDLGDSIEKERRVGSSYFKPDHFTNATAFAAKLKAGADPVSQHVYGALSADTRSAIGSDANSSSARKLLAADLNKLLEAGPLFEASRFAGVSLSQHVKWFVEENPQSHTRIRLNRLLLEEAYPQEITKSPGGVYPDREIKTPSNEDSQRCFNEYITDANRRLEHDTRNPGAPRQIKVGEDVKVIGGRVQVSGQVAVMAINGLLTKVIFDANPNHEFYVEESFPLDWMYPHLTPFGIIMKINRNPVPEITQEIVDKDHEFWSEYSERLIGKWITYDTTISNICAFAERVYLKRDFEGFTGDRAFVRDSDAQKAFSKLRSSIGGLYAWRLQNSRSAAEQQRVLKEAEFAFKQSFAYCPYSPEAVFRYINILVSMNRFDDALLLSKTSLKFDPANGQLRGLIDELERIRGSNFAPPTPAAALPQVQKLQETIQQVMALMQAQQTNQALTLVDGLMNSSASDVSAMLFAAQMYNQSFQYSKAETALSRYAKLSGENPEAWFDLAGMQAILSKSNEAMASLKSALTFDAQRKAKAAPGSAPSPHDLVQLAKTDPRFAGIRTFPQFNALIESLSAKQP